MYGMDPGVALGSTLVYRSLWRDPRNSCLYLLSATFPDWPGFPNNKSLHPRTRQGWTHYVLRHILPSLSFTFGFFKTKSFNNLLLISTPTHLPTIKLVRKYRWVWGFRVMLTRVSHSERAITRVIDEVKKSKFGAQAGGDDTNHYISTMSVTLVSPGVRARSTGQCYNIPVSRYRTPFEYADITPLDPGVALGSTRVYRSLWRDPRNSWLHLHISTFPERPGFPNAR